MDVTSLTPEGIEKLQKLKTELESLTRAMENLDGMNPYKMEGLVRAYQDKESEVKRFLRDLNL